MKRIIGGEFGLEPTLPVSQSPPFIQGGDVLLGNGRSAIHLICQFIQPRRVYLPSYLCSSIISAVPNPSFYTVREDLTIDLEKFPQTDARDLIVVINYQGRRSWDSLLSVLPNPRPRILEDSSQALYQEPHPSSDFFLLAPTKFLGVPDGAVLRMRDPLALPALKPLPVEFWRRSLLVREKRRQFDQGLKVDWYNLCSQVRREVPIGPYRMSNFSKGVLSHLDHNLIQERRRENYNHLFQALGQWSLFPTVDSGTCPFRMCLKVPKRDDVLQRMIESSVYPTVQWNLLGVVPPEFTASHRLAGQILCLPCDQRYDVLDMERVIEIFKRSI